MVPPVLGSLAGHQFGLRIVTTVAVEPLAEQLVPEGVEPATTLSVSTTARLEPAVLWERRGRDAEVGELFDVPNRWRISWSFSCRSFAHTAGQLQALRHRELQEGFGAAVRFRGSGSLPVTGGGRGRLIIESVCDRWVIKAVAA